MASWVGSDIKEIENLWGPPTSIVKRSEGEAVYQYHRTEVDPSCVHYWIVGDDGIITGFFHEGYCRPIG